MRRDRTPRRRKLGPRPPGPPRPGRRRSARPAGSSTNPRRSRRRRAVAHRRAGIDDEREPKRRLVGHEPHDELLEPGERRPRDAARIVADGVWARVDELGAGARFGAPCAARGDGRSRAVATRAAAFRDGRRARATRAARPGRPRTPGAPAGARRRARARPAQRGRRTCVTPPWSRPRRRRRHGRRWCPPPPRRSASRCGDGARPAPRGRRRTRRPPAAPRGGPGRDRTP